MYGCVLNIICMEDEFDVCSLIKLINLGIISNFKWFEFIKFYMHSINESGFDLY